MVDQIVGEVVRAAETRWDGYPASTRGPLVGRAPETVVLFKTRARGQWCKGTGSGVRGASSEMRFADGDVVAVLLQDFGNGRGAFRDAAEIAGDSRWPIWIVAVPDGARVAARKKPSTRVGAHRAVVWKLVKRRPDKANLSRLGVSIGPQLSQVGCTQHRQARCIL